MRDRIAKTGALVAVAALFSGCATVNPYHEDTMCPARNDFGQCVSMTEAYEQTLQPEPVQAHSGESSTDGAPVSEPEAKTAPVPAADEGVTYRKELYKELGSLLRDSKTPLLKPPTIRRILVMPYEDDALYMPRFIYVAVDQGMWVLEEQNPDGREQTVELFSEHEK